MAIAPAVTTTTTTTLVIAPAIRRRLLTELKAYAALKAEAKAIDMAMKKHVAKVREIRESLDQSSISLEGFTASNVQGTYSKLNEQKYVQLGGELSILREATELKPKRAYEKVTVPGVKDGEDE